MVPLGYGKDRIGSPADRQDNADPAEIDLVDRTCAGDRAAAEELFLVVLGPLLAGIARYWNCEDLPDEFFVYLSENGWRRLKTFSGKSPFKAWARIVARRLCAHMMKDLRRSVSLSDEEDRELPDGQDSALTQLIESERSVEVANILEELENPRDREVLRMFLFERLSAKEIAVLLGCPVDGVYVIKLRAIRRLQQRLKGGTGDADPS